MDDFNKPIRPIKRSELNTMKIEPISDKTHEHEKTSKNFSESNKNSLILSCLYIINNLFNRLSSYAPYSQSIENIDAFQNNLQTFKNLLIKIRDENPTNDLQFAGTLSQMWHTLKLNFSKNSNNLPLNFFKINLLISSIEHYPEDSEHSFGFYLSHYSGTDWFPIPFFQLLNRLHEEPSSKNRSSKLESWIQLINEILFEDRQ